MQVDRYVLIFDFWNILKCHDAKRLFVFDMMYRANGLTHLSEFISIIKFLDWQFDWFRR